MPFSKNVNIFFYSLYIDIKFQNHNTKKEKVITTHCPLENVYVAKMKEMYEKEGFKLKKNNI